MIVRVRALTRARVCVFYRCVYARVCMRACVLRQVATITVKRSGSLGFRRMTPTGYERGGARLPVDEPLFGARARPNSNEPRGTAQTLRSPELRNTSERSNNPIGGDFARARIRAVVVCGVHRQAGIFNMR